jgi:oxalate decarboxylase
MATQVETVLHAPEPIRGDEGASIIGPTNPEREAQSRDRFSPPSTDHGTLPSLKWSFADSHNRLEEGGWARQTTGRELPVAQALNCVNMGLKAGVVRELHWHKPDEWGFVIKGRIRITSVDENGRAFQDDVNEGDIWNFPGGIPHSLQGLAGEGTEFLLVFNDGNFNEDETFLLMGSDSCIRCDLGTPGRTDLSTKGTCQLERTENLAPKRTFTGALHGSPAGRASLLGEPPKP